MKSVLFYSFKGGVGRTQAMLNIAKYLAKEQNKKILIVDFDIYAPGVSYLAKFGENNKQNPDIQYLISYLSSLFSGKQSSLYYEEYLDNITIIPAYNIKAVKSYHNKLSELSQYLYSLKSGAEERKEKVSTIADVVFKYIMESIKNIGKDFDYVFFDARTGITEVSDILFSNFLDLKVIISSYNKQNIQGTNDILDLLSEQRGQAHKILRILSPKPIDFKHDIFKEILAEADLESSQNLSKMKHKFEWIGTYEINYEKEIVSNDIDAWEKISADSEYKQNIISIANTLVDRFENNRLDDILERS